MPPIEGFAIPPVPVEFMQRDHLDAAEMANALDEMLDEGEVDAITARWTDRGDRSEPASWLRGGFPSWFVEHNQIMDDVTARFLAQAGM